MRVNCSGDAGLDLENRVTIDSETPWDLRFALIAANLTRRATDVIPRGNVFESPQQTAMICKIDYSIQKTTLTIDYRNESLYLGTLHNKSLSHLPHLSGLQLGEVLFAMQLSAAIHTEEEHEYSDAIFRLMVQTLDGRSASLSQFFDIESMRKSFATVSGGLLCYFVREELLHPDQMVAEGKVSWSENRLHVHKPSAWVMIGGFMILSLLSLSLWFLAPLRANSQNPALPASLACILASSPSLQDLMRSSGDLPATEILQRLQGYRFQVNLTHGSFSIEAMETPHISKADAENSSYQVQAQYSTSDRKPCKEDWEPLFSRTPMIIFVLSLPLLSLICLEVIYRFSVSNGGISNASSVGAIYIRYPSSMTVLVIAALFNSLDFTVTSFAPFHALQSHPTLARRGILTNLHQMIPL